MLFGCQWRLYTKHNSLGFYRQQFEETASDCVAACCAVLSGCTLCLNNCCQHEHVDAADESHITAAAQPNT
jgi:hypothetical protein